MLVVALLAGCALSRKPPPRQVFDTSRVTEAEEAGSVRVTSSSASDEDPAVVRAGAAHA